MEGIIMNSMSNVGGGRYSMKLSVSSRGVSPIDGTRREIRGMGTRG
ncbi:hypothetical protein J5U22_01892 [Saccharolobus shibatae]|uniref:Uncharacterized protein n=1 Tax=Saccharolobus shibatae TaxID=2286 RepID=A0A8F5C1S2_9CREN|nr:hypothetical protein J5U22_01892 [Saccharolobus shibatae]